MGRHPRMLVTPCGKAVVFSLAGNSPEFPQSSSQPGFDNLQAPVIWTHSSISPPAASLSSHPWDQAAQRYSCLALSTWNGTWQASLKIRHCSCHLLLPRRFMPNLEPRSSPVLHPCLVLGSRCPAVWQNGGDSDLPTSPEAAYRCPFLSSLF